ncbi:putative ABC multidrug transporter SitT [Colletotrichum sublineola]|uniref:Putative ABC multidrug transporter SitT n=1 Tax=Colletotrichum sublineola TaxID=1173701 RepID=A0A066X3C4_COLSU|nr:putative ABC multidrug transporter SitT [Colletotrichum sublineola]
MAVSNGDKLVNRGQRQCVVLVRALIRDPKVLILDEAIALLDSASEHRIQMGVGNVSQEQNLDLCCTPTPHDPKRRRHHSYGHRRRCRANTSCQIGELAKYHSIEEDGMPSRTSTAVESSAASINIEKHGVDPADLAQEAEEKQTTSYSGRTPGWRR